MRRQIAYNMDCMDLMKMLPDKEFDLAIVDPPYGINISQNIGLRKKLSTYESKKHKIQKWDAAPPNRHILMNFFGSVRIKSFGAEIILSCHRVNVLLSGKNLEYPKT